MRKLVPSLAFFFLDASFAFDFFECSAVSDTCDGEVA
jgi:hypothetical protein